MLNSRKGKWSHNYSSKKCICCFHLADGTWYAPDMICWLETMRGKTKLGVDILTTTDCIIKSFNLELVHFPLLRWSLLSFTLAFSLLSFFHFYFELWTILAPHFCPLWVDLAVATSHWLGPNPFHPWWVAALPHTESSCIEHCNVKARGWNINVITEQPLHRIRLFHIYWLACRLFYC